MGLPKKGTMWRCDVEMCACKHFHSGGKKPYPDMPEGWALLTRPGDRYAMLCPEHVPPVFWGPVVGEE